MTARVIQGFFMAGRPRAPAAMEPSGARFGPTPGQARPHGVPAPAFPAPVFPAPAFTGRPPVALAKIQAKTLPRPPGPPAPVLPGRPAVGQARPASPHLVQANGASEAFQVDPGRLGLASGGGRSLPDAIRGRMEAALGADFSAVRVHVGPQAERIGAVAFTTGSDIYFAPGRFQPETVQGRQLLGHELAHVVQQRQGRVRNPMGAGVAVVQDWALEAEADRLGHRAAALPAIAQPRSAGATRQSSAVGPANPTAPRGRAVAQPFLPLGYLAGAAAVAGLGYLYDRYLASDETRLRVRRYTTAIGPWRDPVLSSTIGETVSHIDRGGVTIATVNTGRNAGQTTPTAAGYDVDIDPLPDRDARLSYLHHELTHVAADRSYPMNVGGNHFYNTRATAAGPAAGVGAIGQKLDLQVNQAIGVVTGDAGLSLGLRTHCLDRLNNYAGVNSLQEFDTVMNELLLYLYLKGAQGTASYNFIRGLARQRQFVRSL